MPASGDQTLTDIRVSFALNGIFGVKPNLAAAVTVVPAKVSEPAARTTLTTLLAALAGSATTLESSAPPKPIRP